MLAICCNMEVGKRYSIAYKGLKNSTYDFDFEVDDTLFAAYESKDIHGGNCHVEVSMLKNERQLDFDVEIFSSNVEVDDDYSAFSNKILLDRPDIMLTFLTSICPALI